MNPYNTREQAFAPEKFSTPDPFCYPIYSWVWNDDLTKEKIYEQLDFFAENQMKNLYILPISKKFRNNMPSLLRPDYLQDSYLDTFRDAILYGKEKGLRFWLYDEDAWPSASCGGQVVRKYPELIQKNLQHKSVLVCGGTVYDKESPMVLAAYLDGQRISLPYHATRDVQLSIYYVEERNPFQNPYPDLLDPRTASAFLECTHERYAELLGEAFSHLLPCVFIDEPNLPPLPWTPGLSKIFQERFGYDLCDHLPALLDETDTDKQSVQARIDYRYLISALLVENFYQKLSTWCQAHNVLLTGHADGDDTLLTHYQNGQILSVLRTFDIPGIDVILRQIFPKSEYTLCLDFKDFVWEKKLAENKFFPRMAASAARQSGKPYAVSECFAVYGNGLTYAQMNYIINFQAVRGINVFNLMNTPYSTKSRILTGLRPIFPAQQPGVQHRAYWNTGLARLSYLLRIGKADVTTALYMPIRDIWAGGSHAQAVNTDYENIGHTLEKKHIAFDIIDDEAILTAPLGNHICVGMAKYQRIIIPNSTYIPEEVYEKLNRFAQQTQVEVLYSNQIDSIQLDGHPRLSENTSIRYIRRFPENGILYYLYNEGFTEETASITFTETKPMYLLNTEDGTITRSDSHTLSLRLACGQGLAVLFTDLSLPSAMPAAEFESARERLCFNTLDVQPLTKYILQDTLSNVPCSEPAKTIKLPQASPPFGKTFSGLLKYTVEFDLPKLPDTQTAWLDLGCVCYSCQVALNGHMLGILLAEPYRLAFPAAFLQLHNRLEIQVANTLANQFIHTDAFRFYDYRNIGTYHYIQQEFEKESCDYGLQTPITLLW